MNANVDPVNIAYVLGHMAVNGQLDEDLARRILAVVASNHPEIEEPEELNVSFYYGWHGLDEEPSIDEILTICEALQAEIAQAKTAPEQDQSIDLEIWGWINDL